MNKQNSLGSKLALAAAALAAAFFIAAPTTLTGQPPAGKGGPGKGGPGAFGGGKGGPGGGKGKAPAGPVPRTKDGKPDMTGFWGGVTPGGNINIEPQAKGGRGGGKGVIIDPADSLVPYTAAARAKSDDIKANRMFLEPELHCFPSGVPHQMWVQFGSQFIQNREFLVMLWEFKHDRRIIPLDGRPLKTPASVRQFQGESTGHWEGDTLVIHTVHQTAKTWFDTSGTYAPQDIDVVERLTMTDANTIHYEATVTSPTEFTQPMKLEGNISRANANDPTYEQMEFGCVEGNQDLQHYTEDVGGGAANVGPLKQ